jgi:hypothetical protein
MNSRIASGAGIAVGGNSPASKAVERAMQTEVMNGHDAGEDPVETKARLMAARLAAKPAERR